MATKENNIQFWTLNISSYLAQTGIIIINLALVYYLTSLSATPSFIGLSSATYTFCYLVGCLALGSLYERVKPRKMVMLSLFGMAFSIAMVVLVKSLKLSLIFLSLYGLFMSMLWPQMESWITRGKEGKALNKATMWFNLMWSSATGVSSYIATYFISKSVTIGLLSGVVTLFITFVMVFVISTFVPSIRAVKGEREANKEKLNLVDNSTTLRFYSWIGVASAYLILAILNNIFPLYAQSLSFSASTVGSLLVIRGLTTFVCFILLGKANWWQFKFSLIILSQIILALCCVFSAYFNSVLAFAFVFFVIGVLISLIYDFSIFHSASGAVNRNKRMIIHEVMINGGAVIGSLLGGGIYENFGYSFLMWCIAILLLLSTIVQSIVYKIKSCTV